MRWASLAALVLVATCVVPSAAAQPTGNVETAAEPVLRQLEAFRRNDYDLAYTFASREIHGIFDRQDFERMVKTGYPEIADSRRVLVVDRRVAPTGHVVLVLKIRGANGQHIEAIYDMVWESGAWKINGVVARPDPGEEA